MSTAPEVLATADREAIYTKLRFLSTVIGGMSEQLDKGIMDDNDFWAIGMLLNNIANEIYPERKRGKRHE